MSDMSDSSAGEVEVQVGYFILYDIEPGYLGPAFVVDVYGPNMWVAPMPVLILTRSRGLPDISEIDTFVRGGCTHRCHVASFGAFFATSSTTSTPISTTTPPSKPT